LTLHPACRDCGSQGSAGAPQMRFRVKVSSVALKEVQAVHGWGDRVDEGWRDIEGDADETEAFMKRHPDRQRAPAVAAVLGPYGAAAESGGDYDYDYSKVDLATLKAFHKQRATVLAEAGADVLLFETMTCMKAIKAVLEEIHMTAWICFVVAPGDCWAWGLSLGGYCEVCCSFPLFRGPGG